MTLSSIMVLGWLKLNIGGFFAKRDGVRIGMVLRDCHGSPIFSAYINSSIFVVMLLEVELIACVEGISRALQWKIKGS